MRQLALEAEVTVATLYNLVGARDDVIRALSLDVLEKFAEALVHLDATDPLDRAHEVINAVIDIVVQEVPRPLVLAALADERLTSELGSVWRTNRALADTMRAMIEVGQLERKLSPDAVAEQVWSAYTRHLRQWAAGLLDDVQFRARALYILDLCLLALATAGARDRLLAHARSLEDRLSVQQSVPSSARANADQ